VFFGVIFGVFGFWTKKTARNRYFSTLRERVSSFLDTIETPFTEEKGSQPRVFNGFTGFLGPYNFLHKKALCGMLYVTSKKQPRKGTFFPFKELLGAQRKEIFMYNEYTTLDTKNTTTDTPKSEKVEILKDEREGRHKPWRKHKLGTIELAESYQRLGIRKSYLVKDCGTVLEFKRFLSDGSMKLHQANFCKVRLCPMCAWRRSLKIFGQVSQVMDKALEEKDYRFIFLTLTCKNVEGEDLAGQLDDLFGAYSKMMRRRPIKRAIKGWFRALEVTHDTDRFITEKRYEKGKKHYEKLGIKPGDVNPNFDTYHPHFHVVLMVTKSYFTNPDYYINHATWRKFWQESMQVDYEPQVNVKAFQTKTKDQTAKSIAETAKYTVKSRDFIIRDQNGEVDEELTDSAVLILDQALSHRRLVAFGGELRRIHKELNLDDAIEGSLENTDNDDEINADLAYVLERYNWNVGYNQYVQVERGRK